MTFSVIFYVLFFFLGIFVANYINFLFMKTKGFLFASYFVTYFMSVIGFQQEAAEHYDAMKKELNNLK